MIQEDDYAVNGVFINCKEAEEFHKRLEKMKEQMTRDEKAKKILNKLVLPQMPFPLSVPKEFALKCAKRAKKEIDDALSELKSIYKIDEEKLHSAIMGSYCGQRADEKIIDWDKRMFDTRLLAKKIAHAIDNILDFLAKEERPPKRPLWNTRSPNPHT